MKRTNLKWQGVIPAMTTAFKPGLSVDQPFHSTFILCLLTLRHRPITLPQ
jgi:hypothetical protein